MNSVLSFFAAPLIAIQLVMIGTPTETICKKADLVVQQISTPDYAEEIESTSLDVIIKNTGKSNYEATIIKAFHLDISYGEAKKTIKNKEILELIAENNGRAEYNAEKEYAEVDENEYDYDFYWEVTEKIPSLKPNEEVRVNVSSKKYWIYDSNCEIRVIVDPEKKVEECNDDNNQLDFFDWG